MSGISTTFAKLPTASKIEAFNHDKAFGIIVSFAEKDFGWGEITLAVDKETGEARCDLERMSPQHCGEILMRTVGTRVMGAE